MSDTNPPPSPITGSAPPPAMPPHVTILTGGHSVSPPPPPSSEEKHPIMKAAKWVGAVIAILSGLVAAVTGIWNVGALIDDLNDTRAELASLHTSFNEYQEETGRRNEIQAEILNNLRIAVASIQAVAEYRSESLPRPAVRVRTTPRVSSGGASHGTAASRPPSLATPDISSPPLVAETAHLEISEIMRSLPPLPPQHPPSPGLPPNMSESPSFTEADIAHESATADIALERVEILQDAL